MYELVFTLIVMKIGDHRKRRETQTRILIEIIDGNNTAQGLKGAFCGHVSTDMTLALAKFHYEIRELPLPDPEQLDDERREIRDEWNMPLISKKAVDYHLRELVKSNIIVKSGERYHLNRRSVSAVSLALSFISSLPEYKEGFDDLLDIYSLAMIVSGARTGYILENGPKLLEAWAIDTSRFMAQGARFGWFIDGYGRQKQREIDKLLGEYAETLRRQRQRIA